MSLTPLWLYNYILSYAVPIIPAAPSQRAGHLQLPNYYLILLCFYLCRRRRGASFHGTLLVLLVSKNRACTRVGIWSNLKYKLSSCNNAHTDYPGAAGKQHISIWCRTNICNSAALLNFKVAVLTRVTNCLLLKPYRSCKNVEFTAEQKYLQFYSDMYWEYYLEPC